MKLLSGVFLTSIVCFVSGIDSECLREGAKNCLRSDVSPEEECGIVRDSVIDCLKKVTEKCHCEEKKKELEEALKLCPDKEEAPSTNIAGNLDHDAENKIPKEQRRKCLSKLSSKFSSTEERCREIEKALKCLQEARKKLHDDDYVGMIVDLKNDFVRHCEKKEYKEGCPELLTEEFGIIYSPGFPRSSSGIVDCWTRIQVNESEGLVLFVDWLGTDTSSYTGEKKCTSTSEYIQILFGKHLESNRGDAPRLYCLDMVQTRLSNTSPLLHFYSEDPINDVGYTVIYASFSMNTSSTIWGVVDKIEGEYPECVKENANSIFQCVELHADIQALNRIEDMGYDLWYAKCLNYENMAECFVRRTNETCNETEVSWATETMSELLKRDPDSERCLRNNAIHFPSVLI